MLEYFRRASVKHLLRQSVRQREVRGRRHRGEAAGVGPRADDAVDPPSHAGRFERVCVPTMHALPGAAPAALAWRDTP